MSGWRDCVVTLIDLVGIRKFAEQPDTRASELMRQMHALVLSEMNTALPAHSKAYIWNDSVLLLAFRDNDSPPAEPILWEIDGLKRKIDALAESRGLGGSYAIAVKGQSFPDLRVGEPSLTRDVAVQGPRALVIEASSYALANCFLIEQQIGKILKQPWYVDSRLATAIETDQVPTKKRVKLLPGAEARDVYVYAGYLWSAI